MEKRIKLLAKMYAHITGDTEADALRQIKRTDAGRAIADESEIYLYNQPTHNLTEIAWELEDEALREKFTESAIDAAYLAAKNRETAEKRRQTETNRFFKNVPPGAFEESDEEDEAEDDEPDEAENDEEDEAEDDEPDEADSDEEDEAEDDEPNEADSEKEGL